MGKQLLILLGLLIGLQAFSANTINPDKVYDSSIKTIRVHPIGNALALPVISLNQMNTLEISFDDLKAKYQNYYYSVELMNADWRSAN